MIKIEFPKEKPLMRQSEKAQEIFDPVRKKWLILTPEEWVRQNMIQFLLSKNYPNSLLAIEKGIKQGELSRRCDIVIYARDMTPFMIIECKEMNVMLNEKTMAQILRYHITLQVNYLIITNGSYCFGFEKKDGNFFEINEFPDYEF